MFMGTDFSATLNEAQAPRSSRSEKKQFTISDMKTIEEIRRANLKVLVQQHGSLAALSNKTGKSAGQISQWCNASPDSKTGKPRNISGPSARTLEELVGKPKGWLDQAHSGIDYDGLLGLRHSGALELDQNLAHPVRYNHNNIALGISGNYDPAKNGISNEQTKSLESESNVSPGPRIRGRVPLISWVQAGNAAEVIDLLEPGDAEDWITSTVQVNEHTYALRIEGDSMSPEFPPGMILIVEPDMDPEIGDYVIAKNGSDEATFKKLVKDGGVMYLKPLNPAYPMFPLDGYRVIGVVRDAVRKLR